VKKTLLLVFILLISISLFGCTSVAKEAMLKNQAQEKVEQLKIDEQKKINDQLKIDEHQQTDKKAVEDLVKNFGVKLQTVSLLAPKKDVEKSMKENYAAFVSPTLITKWIAKPLDPEFPFDL